MNNKDHKLSIIIPCYNCASTLEEALASVYTQNITLPFEIIMVDDGSTDNTKELIISLAKKHKEIKYFFHDKNKGGGATRNTAISKSNGDLIFCLDSDDILGENMLQKMVNFLIEKECDGVGISKSIKFNGKNINNIAYTNNFGYIGEKIPFESLFDPKASCSLYSTFLHTKKAFDITGGYPTDHGFDTQGFAFRFLANGLIAFTCPDTIYFHRINNGRSYYIREYEAGKASHNWFKIYEEFLFLFNDDTKEKILSFNLNNSEQTIVDLVNNINDKFIRNYKELIIPDVKGNYQNLISTNKIYTAYDHFWIGNELYKQEKYKESVDYLVKSIKLGLANDKIYLKTFDSLVKINNLNPEDLFSKIILLDKLKPRGKSVPFIIRLVNKIKKVAKRIL